MVDSWNCVGRVGEVADCGLVSALQIHGKTSGFSGKLDRLLESGQCVGCVWVKEQEE